MSKIVRGIKKVVQGIGKVVKKVWKSKFGKMLMIAAGAFFAGPAILGLAGAGGAAAAGGLSGLAGASANVAAAWSGLSTAASSALASNFGTAFGQLGTAASGGLVEGAMGGANAAANVGAAMTGAEMAAGTAAAAPTALQTGVQTAVKAAPYAQKAAGVIGNVTAADAGPSQYAVQNVGAAQPADQSGGSKPFSLADYMQSKNGGVALQVGGQMLSGIGQGYAASSAQKHQEEMAAKERKRYGANVGTRLW